ncbi:MAG: HAD family phosphatase [Kiritimatiellae bacterium]|nr:HAD family phosphatase [Kiritimatiellia bacterium]
MLAGVIFDFDGVIVDTEPLHYEALQRVLRRDGLGYAWEDYLAVYIGFDDRDALREAYRTAGRAVDDATLARQVEEKAAVFESLVRERGVKPYPGVVELVQELAGKKPVALCSGALRRDVSPILDGLGLNSAFDAIVTADDVARSKPDPESYRRAFEGLVRAFPEKGLRPEQVLAVEDTPSGIESARQAGLRVLAVTHSHPAPHLNGAVRIVDTLAGVNLARLQEWMTGAAPL